MIRGALVVLLVFGAIAHADKLTVCGEQVDASAENLTDLGPLAKLPKLKELHIGRRTGVPAAALARFHKLHPDIDIDPDE